MQANQGQAELEAVLQSYGDPYEVAERLVLERGIDTNFRRRFSWSPVRWALSGLATVITVVVISIFFLIKTFTPFFEIDEEENRLRMFGGAIDIPFESEVFRSYVDSKGGQEFSGNLDTVGSGIIHLEVSTLNGKHIFQVSSDPSRLSWDCKGQGEAVSEDVTVGSSRATVDFTTFVNVDCRWQVPQDLELTVKHENGLVEVRRPRMNINVTMNNGEVKIEPAVDVAYMFDLRSERGVVDRSFTSNDAAEYTIKVRLSNGAISAVK